MLEIVFFFLYEQVKFALRKAAGQRYLGIELKQLGSAAIDQTLENWKEPQESKSQSNKDKGKNRRLPESALNLVRSCLKSQCSAHACPSAPPSRETTC